VGGIRRFLWVGLLGVGAWLLWSCFFSSSAPRALEWLSAFTWGHPYRHKTWFLLILPGCFSSPLTILCYRPWHAWHFARFLLLHFDWPLCSHGMVSGEGEMVFFCSFLSLLPRFLSAIFNCCKSHKIRTTPTSPFSPPLFFSRYDSFNTWLCLASPTDPGIYIPNIFFSRYFHLASPY